MLWDNDLIVPKITITFCKLCLFTFIRLCLKFIYVTWLVLFIGCDLRTHMSHLKKSQQHLTEGIFGDDWKRSSKHPLLWWFCMVEIDLVTCFERFAWSFLNPYLCGLKIYAQNYFQQAQPHWLGLLCPRCSHEVRWKISVSVPNFKF